MGIAVGALNPLLRTVMAFGVWYLDSNWFNFIGMMLEPAGKEVGGGGH